MATAVLPTSMISLHLPAIANASVGGHAHGGLEIAKRVTFFRNGDIHFTGRRYLISDRRFRTWEALLTELSYQIGPAAVQQVFDATSKRPVTLLSQIQDGASYVCAGHERLHDIDYEGISRKLVFDRKARKKDKLDDAVRSEVDAASKDGLIRRRPPRAINHSSSEDETRVLTVYRNGEPTSRGSKLALSRRLVQNFDHLVRLVEDVSPVVGGVRKLFTTDGRPIFDPAQLFQSESPKEIVVVGTDKFDRTRWAQFKPTPVPVRALPPLEERLVFAPAQPTANKGVRHSLSGGAVSPLANTHSANTSNGNTATMSPAVASLSPLLRPPNAFNPSTNSRGNSPLPNSLHPSTASPTSTHHTAYSGRYVPASGTSGTPLAPVADRSSSPELDTLTEFVPTEEPVPNLVDNFLIQAQAPTVKANQERERQQRGYRLKMSVRVKSQMDTGAALAQQQQSAHLHLVDKIETERRRQQSVLESKRAQLHNGTRMKEIHMLRVRLGAAARIAMFVAHSRIVRRRKNKQTYQQQPPPANTYHQLAQKRHITTPDLTVSKSMVVAVQNKAASVIQAHIRGYLQRRDQPGYSTAAKARKSRAAAAASKKSKPIVGEGNVAPAQSQAQESALSSYGMVDEARVTSLYDLGDKLGDGNFAIVKRCVEKASGKKFAMKIMDKAKTKGVKETRMIENEVAVMRSVEHPNIIKLEDVFDTPKYLYLVLELSEGGDLFDRIVSKGKYSEADAAVLVFSLATAVQYLHARNIIHRDLKPENLLVYQDPLGRDIVKLADFGLSMVVTEPLHTVCGTPTYVAPEIIGEDPGGYGLEVDMWAIGVIMYILLCGFPPFASANKNQRDLFDRIKQGRFSFPDPYWKDISSQAKDLIVKLLRVDKTQRLTAAELLRHPWLLRATDVERPYIPRRLSARDRWKAAVRKITVVRAFPQLVRSDT